MRTCRHTSCATSNDGRSPWWEEPCNRRPTFSDELPSPVEALAERLLARARGVFPETHFARPLKRAAREAVALTEKTGYALLLLPELFTELAVAGMLKAEYLRLGRI